MELDGVLVPTCYSFTHGETEGYDACHQGLMMTLVVNKHLLQLYII